MKTRRLPRRVDLAALLDTLLICAVLTILIVRTELYLTHYPQLGGHGLHIAHLLWGGLLMLISLSLLLAFVTPAVRQLAAVAGGIGFGLFIDEVGKFVTADNNYFFKPSAAIIYCVFIVAFVIVRQLERRSAFTRREYLLNTIEMIKDVPLLRMGDERRAACEQAARASRSVRSAGAAPAPDARRSPCAAIRAGSWPGAHHVARLRARLLQAVDRPGFERLVVVLVGVWVFALLLQVAGLTAYTTPHLDGQEVFRLGSHVTNIPLSDGGARVHPLGAGVLDARSPSHSRSPASCASCKAIARPPSACSSGRCSSRSSSSRCSRSPTHSSRPPSG